MPDCVTPVQDSSTIDRIRAGDRDAFESLVDGLYDRLCDFACRYVESTSAAEDIVQEILLKVWKTRESWRPKGTARAYLFKAVRNRALNHKRDRQTRRDYEDEVRGQFYENGQSPLESTEMEELTSLVNECFDDLPERRREIFTLHRRDGLTYKEIGEVLDISVNTVDTQIRRSLDHFRDRLSEYLDE